jgi:hypothetical protein
LRPPPPASGNSGYTETEMSLNPPGALSFDVSGELAASDPDTLDSESLLGRMVTLTVVQHAIG